MAARLLAWAPNGAVAREASPVTARIERDGTLLVAGGAQDREAGQVLRGHGDEKQRHPEADQRRWVEGRPDQDEARKGEGLRQRSGEAERKGAGEPRGEDREDGDGRADDPHDQEQCDEGQHEGRHPLRALEGADDEAHQHAGEHGGGDRRRDALDERADRAKKGGEQTRAPQSRKAPTAFGRVSPVEAAIRAAPGVDQAVMIGSRWRMLSKVLVAAMARQRAATQEMVCAGVGAHGASRRR